MSDNVVMLPVVTRLDLDPDLVLDNLKGKLSGFVLCGYGVDGEEFFSSTISGGPEALWIIERCKKALLSQIDKEE